MESGKVFVDTSVIIAALLSPTGGSAYLFDTYRDAYTFLINEHVLKETLRVVADKLEDALTSEDFFRLAKLARMKIVLNPPLRAIRALEGVIEKDDCAILASALLKADYLITLDNLFFSETVLHHTASHGLRVLKPKEFIDMHR